MDITPILQLVVAAVLLGPMVFLAVRHARRTPAQRRRARELARQRRDDFHWIF